MSVVKTTFSLQICVPDTLSNPREISAGSLVKVASNQSRDC